MTNIILHQFASSHFNEKARWALDYKGVSHDRVTYLPGPHMPKIKSLTDGAATSTPVLEAEHVVQGSAAIIDYLEATFPQNTLLVEPSNKIIEWQCRLDAELGPAVRSIAFGAFASEPGYLMQTFAGSKPALKRQGYRALMPIFMPVIKKANGADSVEKIDKCREIVNDYLDEIAAAIAETGYIVGSSFTAADLSAAALLAPLANVDHDDMRRPKPIPKIMSDLIAEYENHAAIQWVHKMYALHRP